MAQPESTSVTPPSGSVMVWDAKRQKFTARTPEPSSPPNRSSTSSQVYPPASSSRRRSVPESIGSSLEFRDLLKELDDIPPPSPVGSIGQASTVFDAYHIGDALPAVPKMRSNTTPVPRTTSSIAPPTLAPAPVTRRKSTNSTPKKGILKTVVMEVLGGGRNKDLPKGPVVLPFGRGGIGAIPSKAKSSEKPVKQDPYFAHIALGSPGSPGFADSHFLPNTNVPGLRRKSSTVERNSGFYPLYEASSTDFSSPTTQSFPDKPGYRSAPPRPRPIYEPPTAFLPGVWDISPNAAPLSPELASPEILTPTDGDSPFRGSALPTVSEHYSLSTVPTSSGSPRKLRKRAYSLDSADTPTENKSFSALGTPGLLGYEEQPPMETNLKKRDNGIAVRVVSCADTATEVSNRAERDVEVVSMACTDLDDLASLSGFPLPPTIQAPPPSCHHIRRSSLSSSEDCKQNPRFDSRLGQPRTAKWLPAMPGLPTQTDGTGDLTFSPPYPATDSSPSAAHTNFHLPTPAPPRPLPGLPQVPGQPHLWSTSELYPLVAHHGSTPVLAGTIAGPVQQTSSRLAMSPLLPTMPITPASINSTVSSPPYHNDGGLPLVSPEEHALQAQAEAFAREREILEERVRGLMWLVSTLEQEFHTCGEAKGGPKRPEVITPNPLVGNPSAVAPGPSQDSPEPRSSTSTERVISYYTR